MVGLRGRSSAREVAQAEGMPGLRGLDGSEGSEGG